MTTSIEEIRSLLGLTFEIEGLLILAERREDMTPDEIYVMLQDKCAALLSGVSAINGIQPQLPAEPEVKSVDTAIAENASFEENAHADSPLSEITEAEADQIESTAIEETEKVTIEETPEPSADDTNEEPVVEAPVEMIQITESAQEPEPEPRIPATAISTTPEPVHEAPKPITLTLNDKFRFRRSLFGGSNAQMSDTLAILAGISDPDDLNDFIVNDLCWNPDDPEVVDFIAIVVAAR